MSILKSPYNSFTNFARVLVAVLVLSTLFSQQRWTNNMDVIKSDIRGYYTYLPALFIYDDICLEDTWNFPEEIWYVEEPGKNRYIKYSCGPAMFYAPFFLVAHQLAEPLGYEANGYTQPYRFAVVMSSFFFLLLALFFLSKFLRLHFSDKTTAVTLLILFLGTNIWTYSVNEMAYPHVYSLALVSMLLCFGAKWLQTPTIKWTLISGVVAGLMVLTRPVDGIFLLFFLVYGVGTFSDLKARFQFIWKNVDKVALMILAFAVAMSPQFIYYKIVLGQFFYFTYREEGFFFASPHLYDTLLSFRNGYLIYSPLMVLSLIGFLFIRKHSEIKWFAIGSFALYFFVISSWWCWWYVGFGNRAFINVVPILALPLAAFVEWICTKRWPVIIVLLAIVYGGIRLNFYQAEKHMDGIIHWDGMTKESYVYSFNKDFSPHAIQFKIVFPSYDSAMVGKDYVRIKELEVTEAAGDDFNDIATIPSIYLTNPQGVQFTPSEGALTVTEGVEYLFNQEISIQGVDHLRFSAWVKSEEECSLVVTSAVNPQYYHSTAAIEKRNGEWRLHEIIVDLAGADREGVPLDSVQVYLWNRSLKAISVDDFKIESGNARMSEMETY
jgi:hypothetical protein